MQRAFGPFLGWVNAFNYLVSAFASMSLYPILVIAYLPHHWQARYALLWVELEPKSQARLTPLVQDSLSTWEAFAIKSAFVFIIMLINIWGISWVTRLSLIFLFFILSPFLAEFIALPIMGGLQWEALKDLPRFNDIQWSLFISTTLWSFGSSPDTYGLKHSLTGNASGGYDSMGSVAGEVKDGRRTYIAGISISLPLNVRRYLQFACLAH